MGSEGVFRKENETIGESPIALPVVFFHLNTKRFNRQFNSLS